MLIDWFTFGAQIINFLLLVFLLWRFLYKPILKTMDRRQRQLEDRWKQAEEQRQAAEQEAADYRQKQRELDQQRDHLLAQAQADAEHQRRQQMQQAREEIEAIQQEWQTALEREQDSFLAELRQQMTQQVYQITRQALREVVNADLEQQAIATFLERLRHLGAEKREAITQSPGAADQPVLIRSGFELPEDARQQVIETLQQQDMMDGREVTFDTDPDLICGVELHLAGQSVFWHVADYVRSLEENMAQAFSQKTESSQTRP